MDRSFIVQATVITIVNCDRKTFIVQPLDIACTRSFDKCLTSAEGQKLEYCNDHQIMFFKYHENLVNQLSRKVMPVQGDQMFL